MSKNQDTGKSSAKTNNACPTVGLLMPLFSEDSWTAIWAGVADVARQQDINLICFTGGFLNDPDGFHQQANVLYDLVDVDQLDGLIIWGAIGKHISSAQIEQFYRRYQSIPIISIGKVVPHIPTVLADNYGGMHQAILHLIEDHAYRHIAYIKGHENFQEHEDRYHAYCDALKESNLPVDKNLVVTEADTGVQHDHKQVGKLAVDILLDQRNVQFEAIVVNNDVFAFGVMEALRTRGIKVPEDMPVIGFDDVKESQYCTPPLSTVPFPFYEIGQQAADMLLAQLQNKNVPERMFVPTQLVVRQSCGCMDPAVEQISVATMSALIDETPAGRSGGEKIVQVLNANRKEILAEVEQAIELTLTSSESYLIQPEWFEQLLDAFGAELSGTPAIFLRELDTVLRRITAARGNVMVWHNVISVMRRQLLPYLESEEILLKRAEDLWHQARVAIGEIFKRSEGYKSLQMERQGRQLSEIAHELSNTPDIPSMMDVLTQYLPKLGIARCYLSLYENPDHSLEKARLLMAYDEQGRKTIDADNQVFPARHLAPHKMFHRDTGYSLIVEPLYFREEQQGFVLFEATLPQARIYYTLREQLSGTLQAALLIEKRKTIEEELARERDLLQAFMDTGTDLIYFKDRESRFIKINRRHAQVFGLKNSAEAVGKTDFDFFTDEHASQAYADEQSIIASGEPVINLEEKETWPDGRITWASTSKMPLFDAAGNIVGTFGISRDITERKEADKILSKRAAELETVAQVSTAALTSLDTTELLQKVVDLTKTSFDLYHAHIYLLDDITNDLVLAAGADQVGRQMVAEGWRIPLTREQSLVARAARLREGIIVNNVRQSPDWLPNPLLPDTYAELAVPLIVGDRILGVLDVQSDQIDYFTDDDIRIQTTLAAQVAVALENARLFEQAEKADFLLRERVKELDCLNDIGREMEENPPPLPQLLQWITERIPPAMQHPKLAVAAIEFDGEIYGKSDAMELPYQIVHGLYIGGEILGRIYIAYREKREFIDEESALLGGIATRVSGFIENQRLLEQTQQRSTELEDVLTEVRQLATIVENHPDFIGIIGLEGDVRYINPAGLKLMGLPLDRNVSTMAVDDFYPAEDAEKLLKAGIPAARDKGFWSTEANLLKADGSMVPIEETISINFDIEGKPVSFSMTMHDITNRKVAAAEQARLLAEVEAAYRQWVSHEWEKYLQEQHQGQWRIEHLQTGWNLDASNEWLADIQNQAIQERETKAVSHTGPNGDSRSGSGEVSDRPATVVTPISLRGQVIGTLNLQDLDPDRKWTAEEITLVESVSEQLALTVENLRLFDNTQRRATREQLTRQISDKIHAASDVDTIVETGLAELAKALGVSRTYVKLNVLGMQQEE